MNPWTRLSSRTAYRNAWIRVREDRVLRPDGSEGIYGVVEVRPAVMIVPIGADGRLLVIGQHRYPVDRYVREFPKGGAEGGDPIIAARRELREETGYEGGSWQKLGILQSLNGISDEVIQVFAARNLQEVGGDSRDQEGIGLPEWVTYGQLLKEIRSGDFIDGQSVAGLMLAQAAGLVR